MDRVWALLTTSLLVAGTVSSASVPATHDSVRWSGRTLRQDNGTVKYSCRPIKSGIPCPLCLLTSLSPSISPTWQLCRSDILRLCGASQVFMMAALPSQLRVVTTRLKQDTAKGASLNNTACVAQWLQHPRLENPLQPRLRVPSCAAGQAVHSKG